MLTVWSHLHDGDTDSDDEDTTKRYYIEIYQF